jgi:hypothetical protein
MARFFSFLMLLIAVAIPLAVISAILRRVKQVSSRLGDPTRLQKAFAESAAAALRRAGPDPQSVAQSARFVEPGSTPPKLPVPEPAAPPRLGGSLQRPARPRPGPPIQRSDRIGFEIGDRFRLSEPPEIHEPYRPSFNANWLAFAAAVGAAAYYWWQ